MKAIFLSIKPKYVQKIVHKEKNYEFRNYYPKVDIDKLYVYESAPISALKYVIEIGKVVVYPNKINEVGYGNSDFDKGLKSIKYAYEISKVYELDKSLSLNDLKSKFAFTAPQGYAYDDRYKELADYIEKVDKKLIVDKKSITRG
jgi:predicted transcriptional regulator